MGIQPFSRGNYLHFWNNWLFAKLGTNPISAAMHAFRIILHVSYKATQALSNDLQRTLVQSLVTEIQPFFRWHYLHFWNNWLFDKIVTNPMSAVIHAFRIILHAPCKETQELSKDLQSTLIQSLITEIQPFSQGHYLLFWNNWFFLNLRPTLSRLQCMHFGSYYMNLIKQLKHFLIIYKIR